MSKRPQNEFELEKLIRRKNVFSGNSIGNYLQSIWTLEKNDIERSEESVRLKSIFDLHWAIRLGVDVYEKSIHQLTIHEALFAMGRILYVNVLLSINEGPRGEIAKRLSVSHYQIIACLRQYHDRLKQKERAKTENNSDTFPLTINSYSDEEDEKVIFRSDSYNSNASYRSFNFGYSTYDPLPDYLWWNGFGDGMQKHHDPLMALVSPSYYNGEAWGYIVEWKLRATMDMVNLTADGIHHVMGSLPQIMGEAKHIIEIGAHAVESGVSVLQHDVINVGHNVVVGAQNCCGDAVHNWVDCCTGVGQRLCDCLGGVGHCLIDCTCGFFNSVDGCFGVLGDCLSNCGGIICDFRCDCGGGGGEICGGCCAGCCAIGVWCSSRCCPASSGDDGGLHQVIHTSGLGKTGAMHVSLSAGKLFAPDQVGSYLTGAYVLAFAPPVLYNLWHSAVKLIKGGDHKETASRDRKASAQDLLIKSSLGVAAFFGGLYIPWGGIHTAISFSIMTTYLSHQLSKTWRKKNESHTFGDFPHKPQKYIPGRAALEQLFYSSEALEQPGLDLETREKFYRDALTEALRNLGGDDGKEIFPGRSQAAFLAAQERLDNVGYIVKNCAEAAFSEKSEVLKTHGIFSHGFYGLYRSYRGLFGGHYHQTDQRKELLSAIQGLREGRITETAESYSNGPI